ncbi:MAG: hypothetical protein ACRDZ2_03425, partial [Ilumatobacteraceae bacterium]
MDERMVGRVGAAQVGGLASVGAGAVHAAAAGIHAEHITLSRLFVAIAAVQLAAGLTLLLRRDRRIVAAGTALVNAGAVAAWATTRFTGISWIGGLEQSEAPQFADTVCAALGTIAVVGALLAVRRTTAPVGRGLALALPSVAIGAVAVAAMFSAATHVHSHGETAAGHDHGAEAELVAAAGDETETTAHDHGQETTDSAAPAAAASETTAHDHGQEAANSASTEAAADDVADASGAGAEQAAVQSAAAAWPRAWDPAEGIDFSGVEGVTADQQARAEALVQRTLTELPQFADVATLGPLGYRSIGDARTGHEHYINIGYIQDDAFLDPSKPESLVYAVDGDQRTLVSAMFIAKKTAIDDPALVDYGGALMEWHVHENLCWALDTNGVPQVVGVTDIAGKCPPPTIHAGGDSPMVHVWIAPHECGPFAALEGHGAGQAGDGARTDLCSHDHGGGSTDGATADHGDHEAAAAETTPYDPAMPIDLSGVAGVTPQQQAFAENVVANTVTQLGQWKDPAVAEAFGFRSIGDAVTGHEHYINWGWINDTTYLDPDFPESLVYEPQPDGSKRLVSAMYMLPDDVTLEDVQDYGGALMQWHVHDNLCFTADPVAPQVAGLREPGGECAAQKVVRAQSPMIHVWFEPNECGPFASL